MKLSKWLEVTDSINGESYVAGTTRIRDGGNIDNIDDRYAFIEKTPRVRIRNSRNEQWPDFLNWAERNFKGDGPTDKESQEWCDKMLEVMGYELL